MDFEFGRNFFAKRDETDVGYQNGVYFRSFEKSEIFRRFFKIGILCKNVDGNVDFDVFSVCEFYGFNDFLVGKIIRKSAKRKTLSADLDGVGTVINSRFKF